MDSPEKQLSERSTDWQSFVPSDAAGTAAWLLAPARFSYLLRFALTNLGRPATADDAEEAVQDFVLHTLPRVIARYSSAEGTFWNYLLTALRYACWRRGRKIRQRAAQERTLPADRSFDWAPAPETPDLLQQGESRQLLELAGQELDPRAWRAIQLHHLENKPVLEITALINESVQNVKILLHRGRHDLALLLRCVSASRLRPRDVGDWPRFCQITRQEAERNLRSVPAILYSHLDSEVQHLLHQLAEASTICAQDLGEFVAHINSILPRPDLWPKPILAALRGRSDLAGDDALLLRKRKRGPISTLRLNRLVLEFGFPNLVAVSRPGDADHEQ